MNVLYGIFAQQKRQSGKWNKTINWPRIKQRFYMYKASSQIYINIGGCVSKTHVCEYMQVHTQSHAKTQYYKLTFYLFKGLRI